MLAIAYVTGKRRGQELGWFRRETLALVLVLLAAHSIAARSEAEEILSNPVVLERVVRGALAGLAMVLALPPLIQRITRHERGYRGLTALSLYVFVAFASVLYSVASLVTAAKAIELSAAVVAVAAIGLDADARNRIRQAIGLVITLEAALLTTAVIGFFILPDTFAGLQSRPGFFSEGTLISPFATSNGISATGALLAAFALAQVLEQTTMRFRWIGLFVLGTAGTILASGRQGVAIWVASVAILTFVHRRTLFMTLLAPGTALLVTLYWVDIVAVLSRDRPRNFTNLTGRLPWWQAALDSWVEHPWTGYGFGAGGRFVALRSIGRSSTSSVHSGYFEALVGIGLLGVIPLAYAVLRVAAWSTRQLIARSETELAILIVPLVLRTFISMGFGGWLNAEFVLFALLVAAADEAWIARRRENRFGTRQGALELAS